MVYPFRAGFAGVGAIEHNPLWLPGKHREFMVFTIAGGQHLLPGAVLGKITASGKLVLAAAAAGDGSQTAMAVLGEPMDTFDTDGTTPLDMTMAVCVKGYVNPTALVIGAGMTLAAVQDQLRQIGILSRSPGYSG